MAVQEGPSFKRYAANGIATAYSIPFLLLSADDLVVTLDGVTVTSGFTLAGIGNPTSTATFSVAPTGDLLFLLMVPFQRLNDYQENGDLLSLTLNNDLDRIWLAIKELRRDDQRALSVDPLEPEGIPALPVAALRQLRVLAFDADGDPVPSNLTLAQLEEQPALALESALAAQSAANTALEKANEAAEAAASAEASASFAGDPWNFQPLGVPIPVFDHITGVTAPPTNQPYRYIKLTASDAYNTGVLTGESVSGSAPLVIATAVISLAGSPLNGRTIQLINTERRVLRAGQSGVIESDAIQNIVGTASPSTGSGLSTPSDNSTGAFAPGVSKGLFPSFGNAGGFDLTFDASRVARTSTETRAKSIGVTYYMRIK